MLVADKGASGGGKPAPAPAPGGSPAPEPSAGAKAAPQPQVHEKLLAAISSYDQHIQEAETYYVEMIELVLTEKISRADVVATLMRARKITFETAQSQYSRMKKMWENPEVLKQLKAGEITLKVAREATTKKQANAANGNATGGTAEGAGSKTASTETKEARYQRAQKALIAAVKECGFDLKSALMSFEAELKSAGVK